MSEAAAEEKPPQPNPQQYHRSLSLPAKGDQGSSGLSSEGAAMSPSATASPHSNKQQQQLDQQAHPHHRPTLSTGSFFAGADTTESIVRRVEEEIVSARKASQLAKSRIGGGSGGYAPFPANSGGAAPADNNLATSPRSPAAAAPDSTTASADQSSMAAAASALASDARRRAMMLTVNAVQSADSAASSSASASAVSPHRSLSLASTSRSSPGGQKSGSRNDKTGEEEEEEYEPSFDLMEDILNIQETDSELLLHHRSKDSEGGLITSSAPPHPAGTDFEDDDDAHFQHAMDVIGEEFETPRAGYAASANSNANAAAIRQSNDWKDLEQPALAVTDNRLDQLQRYTPSSSSLSKEPPGSFYDDDEDELLMQPRQVRSVGTGGSGGTTAAGRSSTTSSDRVVMEALSNGETAGQRARAILDTLKSRREHFSSTFRGSGTGSARSTPEVLYAAEATATTTTTTTAAADAAPPPPPPVASQSSFDKRNDRQLPPANSPRRYMSNDASHRSNTVADEKKDDDALTMMPSASIGRGGDRQDSGDVDGAANEKKPSPQPSLTVSTAAASANTPTGQSASTPTPSAMKRVSLPAPDRKKFKSRSKQARGDAATPSSAQASTPLALTPSPSQGMRRKTPLSKSSSPNSDPSSAAPSTSRRIRFRDPFPVLKPTSRPRDPLAMIAAHSVPPPVPITHWLRPKNDLRQLIVAVMGASIQRRAHACGALKVLTQTKKNKLMLMRTDSFLEALVFAASQDIPTKQRHGGGGGSGPDGDGAVDDEEEAENTNRYRSGDDAMLALDARTRAVACLRNICEPKDNRGHVILHPGFKETLMYVIQDDPLADAPTAGGGGGEARVIACGAFALLAKSPECRETFVSTPGLVDLLSLVMAGSIGNTKDEKEASAVALPDVNVSRSGTLSQNTSLLSKQSSMSGRGGDHDHDDEEDDDDDAEDDEDEEEHSNGSDDEDHSHDSSHTSEYTSQPSDSEVDEDDDDESSNARVSPRSSRRKDRMHGHRPVTRRQRGASAAKGDLDTSLPSGADELAHMSSIRQINHEMHAEYLQRARSNACAALLHLSKHCAISTRLCSNKCLIQNLMAVTQEHDNPIHTKCLEILCNLSRFPANAPSLTRFPGLVDALVAASDSPETVEDDRVHALRTLQNMSADPSSKTLLATEAVLSSLSAAALRPGSDEKEAAVAFLYNVSTEPGAVVSITNTKNVVATLVHLAHHPESSPSVRLMSCDALATISLWLQTLAGTGKVPADVPNVPLPSQKTTGWDRWD